MDFIFATTYPWSEPVVKNRLKPLIDRALVLGFNVTLISPGACDYIPEGGGEFIHNSVGPEKKTSGNFLWRAISEAFLARKILSKIDFSDDYVFLSIPSMFLMFLAPRKYPRLILDVRDISWEYLSSSSFFLSLVKKVFRSLAKLTIDRFGFVAVTNTAQRDYVEYSLCFPGNDVFLMSNGISEYQYGLISEASSKKIYSPSLRVTYIGNVGLAQNLLTLVEAAALMPNVEFQIVGTGTDMARVVAGAESRELSNVHFLGRVDWARMPEIYEKTDVLYAQLSNDFSGAVPSKLYEYLATGIPVIYGGAGQASALLESFEGVQVIAPEDSGALSKAIACFVNDRSLLSLSDNNKTAIKENYIRESIVAGFYEAVLKHDWR